jgi:hypothetical protein
MNAQLPWEQGDPNLGSAAQGRRRTKATAFVDGGVSVKVSGAVLTVSAPPPGSALLVGDPLQIRGADVSSPARHLGPPIACEFLLCLAVDPEYQEDRLCDFQEQFRRVWVPKFGRRVAIAMYVWHVLRQSRLIDWFIRSLSSASL